MLLVGINSKYIHSNLAIRYLAKKESRCSFCEYTIQERPEAVAASLFGSGHRAFLFSCYIWNMEHVLKTCEILKKADSSLLLALGGPEVSFSAEDILSENPFIDCILCGEGENAISPFADALSDGSYQAVPGLCYRQGESIVKSEVPSRETDPSDWPFPYDEADISALKNRIVYYETSRGCPYRCTFCLSGSAGTLRFLPAERVERELSFFESLKVPLVKLVDRTFNADPKRALSIIEGIKARKGSTVYHFEIRAESMTEELIKSLQEAPKGMFQLEIGVQSTNPDTLRGINRKPDFERLAAVTKALSKNRNIHLHLDVIAGLPGESMESFIRSFHEVIALRPHNLQLGFLKKLKGSGLTAPDSEFSGFPPYEVIRSDAMSYSEILRLKQAEEMLERYYNSGAFTESISYLLDTYYKEHELDFFCDMADFLGKDLSPRSRKTHFEDFYAFAKENFSDSAITEKLIYDYCMSHRDSLSFMKSGEALKEQAFEFLKQPERVARYFENYAGEKPVLLYKKIRFVPIGSRVFAFDYPGRRAEDVTKEFELEE